MLLLILLLGPFVISAIAALLFAAVTRCASFVLTRGNSSKPFYETFRIWFVVCVIILLPFAFYGWAMLTEIGNIR